VIPADPSGEDNSRPQPPPHGPPERWRSLIRQPRPKDQEATVSLHGLPGPRRIYHATFQIETPSLTGDSHVIDARADPVRPSFLRW